MNTEQKRRGRPGRPEGSYGPTSEAIVDVLTTDGGWLQPRLIMDWVSGLYPEISRGNVERTISRLRDREILERRTVPGRHGDVVEYRAAADVWNHFDKGER